MPLIFFLLLFLIAFLYVSPATISLLCVLQNSPRVPAGTSIEERQGSPLSMCSHFFLSPLSLFSAFIGIFPFAYSFLPASLLLSLLRLKQIILTKQI